MTRNLPTLQADDCWSRIGIRGDRSCPELRKHIHCNNCPVFASAAQGLLDRPAPEGYLSELAAVVAEPAATGKVADQAVVLFKIGNESFAIPSVAVVEVAETNPPRSVPHRSNDVFVGLINMRGQLEVCMSLHGLFGLPSARAASSAPARALLITVENQRWVLLIDALDGVLRFHESALVAVPPTSRRRAREYVKGLIVHEGEHFGLLDLSKVCARLQEKLG